MHEDLRHNARVRAVFTYLGETLPALAGSG
jgi:hypothetical protein